MKFVSLRKKRALRQGKLNKPSSATRESFTKPTAVPHQIHTYTELRQQIRDLLRIQHPEWVQPNGESPMCDSIGRLFSRLEPGSSLHPEGGMILRRSEVRSLRIVYRPLRMAMDAWPLGEARSNP